MVELGIGKLITGVGARRDTMWTNRRVGKEKFLTTHEYPSPALQKAN